LALMSLSGALTSGGISMAQQKHDNGSVDLGTLGKEMAIGAIPIPGGGAAKGAGAIGREAAEGVGREVTETVGREAAEQAASRTGKQELSNIGKNAANDIGDDTARAAHNACNGGNCFVADTPVLMADGTSKPIQDVQAGDEVVAYDPDTDTTQPRTVTRTFVHEQVETLVVRLEDGGTVETTAGHPFLTRDRGWTPAGHLRPGDLLHGPDDTWATVTSVNATGHTRTVYNLEIDDLHTYHVRAGNTWTTVHNMCPKKEVLPTPSVQSSKLQNIVNNLYKGTTNPKRIGNGTTMDAIRHELETGGAVHGRTHSIKGQESIRGLEKWLNKNPNADWHDRLVAQSLVDDLKSALGIV
ncbi:Hint domain-containing protein, partial [Propionibacterium australiense]